jgi:hypothetical protein
VGYLGLMKAINGFDPAIREDLTPYARACVTGEIKRFFRDKRWLIKVSRTDQELLLGAKKAYAELIADQGGTPTDQQVAARLNVSADTLTRPTMRSHQDPWTPQSPQTMRAMPVTSSVPATRRWSRPPTWRQCDSTGTNFPGHNARSCSWGSMAT